MPLRAHITHGGHPRLAALLARSALIPSVSPSRAAGSSIVLKRVSHAPHQPLGHVSTVQHVHAYLIAAAFPDPSLPIIFIPSHLSPAEPHFRGTAK